MCICTYVFMYVSVYDHDETRKKYSEILHHVAVIVTKLVTKMYACMFVFMYLCVYVCLCADACIFLYTWKKSTRRYLSSCHSDCMRARNPANYLSLTHTHTHTLSHIPENRYRHQSQ
jgi:hypothetical protein